MRLVVYGYAPRNVHDLDVGIYSLPRSKVNMPIEDQCMTSMYDFMLDGNSNVAQSVTVCCILAVENTRPCSGLLEMTNINPILFSAIYRRSTAVNQTTSTQSTRLCWWPQIYGFCRLASANSLCGQMSTCVDEVSSWKMANWCCSTLQKTEVLWCSSPRRQHLIPTERVLINNTFITPVRSVKIWEFTSTMTLLWGPTLLRPSDRALRHSGRSAAYDVPCLVSPCWL